jgi:hypothetical protein
MPFPVHQDFGLALESMGMLGTRLAKLRLSSPRFSTVLAETPANRETETIYHEIAATLAHPSIYFRDGFNATYLFPNEQIDSLLVVYMLVTYRIRACVT